MQNQAQIVFVGAQINNYTLVKQLSANAVDKIFLGVNNDQQRVFVVFKMFNQYLTQAIEIIHQQQIQGNFQNIIRVENCYNHNFKNVEFYIIELKKADQNLAQFYQGLLLQAPEQQQILKLQIMTQVTKGLQELHINNIIHRNIKPESILMIGEVAYIGDLGLIKLLSEDDPPSRINSQGYSAPELYTTGQNYTFSVDVYSLGRLFLYILFGEPNEQALIDHKQENSEIGKLIRKMIQEKPNKRPKLNTILNKLQELDGTEMFEEPHLKKQVKIK